MVQYNIVFGKENVGTVNVESVGMYTHFSSKCKFRNDGIYRIIAIYGKDKIDLGICIRSGNSYTGRARVATKHLSGDVPSFYAVDGLQRDTVFIPVEPRKAFGEISKLPGAKFHIQAGQTGLILYEY